MFFSSRRRHTRYWRDWSSDVCSSDLKLSEIDILSKNKQELPIVLIDDVTSYFDRQRCESVLQYLKEKKVQVFLTSTEILNIDAKYYKMEKGEVYEITDS